MAQSVERLGYELDDRGSRARFPAEIFLLITASRTDRGFTQHPIQWLPGALSLGVKRPGRAADLHLVNGKVIPVIFQLSTMPWMRTGGVDV
jgi:hypothetical protein